MSVGAIQDSMGDGLGMAQDEFHRDNEAEAIRPFFDRRRRQRINPLHEVQHRPVKQRMAPAADNDAPQDIAVAVNQHTNIDGILHAHAARFRRVGFGAVHAPQHRIFPCRSPVRICPAVSRTFDSQRSQQVHQLPACRFDGHRVLTHAAPLQWSVQQKDIERMIYRITALQGSRADAGGHSRIHQQLHPRLIGKDQRRLPQGQRCDIEIPFLSQENPAAFRTGLRYRDLLSPDIGLDRLRRDQHEKKQAGALKHLNHMEGGRQIELNCYVSSIGPNAKASD